MDFSSSPHKNLYISGAIATVILVVGFMSTQNINFFQKDSSDGRLVDLEDQTASSTITSRDTDKDGLHDWEEQLYGTDPKKQDTDGDGTFDGAEVGGSRDPLVPNTARIGDTPNDIAKTSNLLLASSTKMSDQQKAFLVAYLTKAGKDIRETTYRDLLSKFDAKKYTPTTQELVGLNITSDNSDEAFRTFINEFGKVILKQKTAHAPANEIGILNEYTKTENEALLKDLELAAIEYQNLVKSMRALPVPSGTAKTMQSIIEGYEGMALGIKGLEQMKTNPIEASGGYEGYTIYRVQVANGFVLIVQEVTKRGLVFTEDEPGYMFYANVFQGGE